MVVLLTVVVPRMEPMFASAGASLPASTRVVLAATDFLREQGFLLLALMAAAAAAGRAHAAAARARAARWTRWLLRVPFLGPLLRDRITAQLCRGLATCLGGGLDLPAALAVCRDILGNLHARAAMEDVITRVRTGRTVADSLAAAGILTPLAVKMLRVGEESGRMQPVAAHLARPSRIGWRSRLQRLVAIIEPATVIVLGLVVGGIVMSILTAVLSVNELAL